jgi:beta-glucosidase
MSLNPTATETRVESILNDLTLQEKIGQLNQVFPPFCNLAEITRQGKAGSALNAAGALTGQGFSSSSSAEELNAIQKIALAESRAKIPLIFGRDVIHGYRTVFPIPLGLAAAFDPELTEKASQVAAREASSEGIKWTFAPMVDIARDSRWGRVAEGAGEDPYLGRLQSVAAVRGFQGDDYAHPERLVACAKHFAGYGAAEGGRDYETSEISMRTMREVYLPPFKAAVEAGAGTLMSAFEDLSGIPMTANRQLLTDVLRGEWGFDGFVVSDWSSIPEVIAHGVAADAAEAAALCLVAGVDMDMVGNTYIEHLEWCLANGKVSMADIDTAVRRILRIKLRAGLFDNPYTDAGRASRQILTPEHRQLAREAATRSIVMLKNRDGLLPLDGRTKRLAVIGPLVHAREELFGCWTPDGRPEEAISLSEAIQAASPAGMQLYFSEKTDLGLEYTFNSDAILLVVGEHPRRSGENNNVADLGLPAGQKELVLAASRMGKPLVLVVIAGRALAIPEEVAAADAVLFVFHPGTEGGAAIADVLFGNTEPGGRLPLTFPRATGQMPLYYNHKNSGRPVVPGFMFARRYVDLAEGPLFPFGYGLTYTQFAYSNLSLSSPVMGEALEITAEVTNTGTRRGSAVAQLYVRDLVGLVTRPVNELKGFQRLTLEPGETQTARFILPRQELSYYGLDNQLVLDPGGYHLRVGPNSAEGLTGEFRVS